MFRLSDRTAISVTAGLSAKLFSSCTFPVGYIFRQCWSDRGLGFVGRPSLATGKRRRNQISCLSTLRYRSLLVAALKDRREFRRLSGLVTQLARRLQRNLFPVRCDNIAMRFVFLKTAVVGCALALSCFAQESVTVPQLIDFIKSSIKQKLLDKDVAAEVAKLHLTQKLEDQAIEDLQTAGAGIRTVAALTHLADLSQKLPAAPPPEAPKPVATGGPPPSEKDQRRIIAAVREYALNYTSRLPDFLCVQRTNRYINRNYKPGDDSCSKADYFTEQLNYLDHHEKYTMLSVNDNSTFGKTFDAKVGGALSRGEWASLMQAVFEPATDTYFQLVALDQSGRQEVLRVPVSGG